MEETIVGRLLAAATGDDAAAVRCELQHALSAADDADAEAELVAKAVACLRSPPSRLAAVSRELLRAEDAVENELRVLDGLVLHLSTSLVDVCQGSGVAKEECELEDADVELLWKLLGDVFRAATTRLSGASRDRRLVLWCDQLLNVVFAAREGQPTGENGSKDSAGGAGDAGRRRRAQRFSTTAARRIVVDLLELHKTLISQEDGISGGLMDFKLETVVWKNLTKLVASYGDELYAPEEAHADVGDSSAVSLDAPVSAVSAEDVVNAVVSRMETEAGWLIARADASNPKRGAILKLLRLYWRAFQGHFVHLTGALSSTELENCVLAAVNTASVLIHTLVDAVNSSPKLQQDVTNLLELVLDLPSKIAESSLGNSGWTILETLLWYPADEMTRAIRERQHPDDPSVQGTTSTATSAHDHSDVAIQWSHFLLLVGFSAAEGIRQLPVNGNDGQMSLSGNDNRVTDVFSKTLDRFRDCAVSSTATALTIVMPFATEGLVELLAGIGNVEELQFVLLKHSMHPNVDERLLCWELWKEFVCHIWESDVAFAAMNLLLDLTEHPETRRDVRNTVLQLVAYAFPALPLALKHLCVERATTGIQTVCKAGPFHVKTPALMAQLDLLDRLADAQFLPDYDHPSKENWIGEQLSMCFECCGSVVQLLSMAGSELRSTPDKLRGGFRVLEVCLVVLKSVFDDNEMRDEASLAELQRVVLPLATATLTQLADGSIGNQQHQPRSLGNRLGGGVRRSPTQATAAHKESVTSLRAVRACLYLLAKLSVLLKRNHSNQYVQTLKDMLSLMVSTNECDQAAMAAIATQFVEATLSDVQVPACDVPVVVALYSQLFQRMFSSASGSPSTASSITSSHGGLKLSPLRSAALDALYALLARSSIAESLTMDGAMMDQGAKNELKALVQLRMAKPDEVYVRFMRIADDPSARDARSRSTIDSHRAFVRMFPPSLDIETTSCEKRAASGDAEAVDVKRRKLVHLVTMCRRMVEHQPNPEQAEVGSVGDEDLTTATELLGGILATLLSC